MQESSSSKQVLCVRNTFDVKDGFSGLANVEPPINKTNNKQTLHTQIRGW
jgi:hypothetical protein